MPKNYTKIRREPWRIRNTFKIDRILLVMMPVFLNLVVFVLLAQHFSLLKELDNDVTHCYSKDVRAGSVWHMVMAMMADTAPEKEASITRLAPL